VNRYIKKLKFITISYIMSKIVRFTKYFQNFGMHILKNFGKFIGNMIKTWVLVIGYTIGITICLKNIHLILLFMLFKIPELRNLLLIFMIIRSIIA